MKLISKLFTAARGAATEAGEAVVDANALRILEQEIRDAKTALDEGRESLAAVMAERAGVARRIEEVERREAQHLEYAEQALAKDDETLATQLCEKAAELGTELETLRAARSELDDGVERMRHDLAESERSLDAMRRQTRMVAANERVQSAAAQTAARFSGTKSALGSASESLERIKARQQEKADRMAAARELDAEQSGADLDARMKRLGIGPSSKGGADLLAGLKAKRAEAAETC